MSILEFKWTDGANKDFYKFYLITEDYYNRIVGGAENRKSFIPYNISTSIQDVLIAYIDDVPVACSGLKKYSESDIEIKRVWVEPEYRGHHIATDMMKIIEAKAKQQGFQKIIKRMQQEDSIEAVILGCTELPLLLNDEVSPIPCLDTMKIHIQLLIDLIVE